MIRVSQLLMAIFAVCSMAVPSFALDTTIADIFTAANISGLNSNVGTLLIGFVGINLLFLGARYLRKSGVR